MIALTPPREREFISRHDDGVEIDTRQVWFTPLENRSSPKKLGFRFFVKSYNEAQKSIYYFAMYIILDSILGERSAAEDVDYFDIQEIHEDVEENIRLIDLPEYIEWRKSKFTSTI